MLTLDQIQNLKNCAIALQDAVDSILGAIQIPIDLGHSKPPKIETFKEPILTYKEPVVVKIPPKKDDFLWETVLRLVIKEREKTGFSVKPPTIAKLMARQLNVEYNSKFYQKVNSLLKYLDKTKSFLTNVDGKLDYIRKNVPHKYLTDVIADKSEELTDTEKVLKCITVLGEQLNSPLTLDQIFVFYKDKFPSSSPHKPKGKDSLRGILSILVAQNKIVCKNDFYDLI